MNKALVVFPWIEADAAVKTVPKKTSFAHLNGLTCLFDALQSSLFGLFNLGHYIE